MTRIAAHPLVLIKITLTLLTVQYSSTVLRVRQCPKSKLSVMPETLQGIDYRSANKVDLLTKVHGNAHMPVLTLYSQLPVT
jgi:hypothetical protein